MKVLNIHKCVLFQNQIKSNSFLFSAVIDAEKALLDDLKQQSQELRLKLSESEHREQSLGEKLAQLLEDKVELEKKVFLLI